jgi:hypothetical protein
MKLFAPEMKLWGDIHRLKHSSSCSTSKELSIWRVMRAHRLHNTERIVKTGKVYSQIRGTNDIYDSQLVIPDFLNC